MDARCQVARERGRERVLAGRHQIKDPVKSACATRDLKRSPWIQAKRCQASDERQIEISISVIVWNVDKRALRRNSNHLALLRPSFASTSSKACGQGSSLPCLSPAYAPRLPYERPRSRALDLVAQKRRFFPNAPPCPKGPSRRLLRRQVSWRSPRPTERRWLSSRARPCFLQYRIVFPNSVAETGNKSY